MPLSKLQRCGRDFKSDVRATSTARRSTYTLCATQEGLRYLLKSTVMACITSWTACSWYMHTSRHNAVATKLALYLYVCICSVSQACKGHTIMACSCNAAACHAVWCCGAICSRVNNMDKTWTCDDSTTLVKQHCMQMWPMYVTSCRACSHCRKTCCWHIHTGKGQCCSNKICNAPLKSQSFCASGMHEPCHHGLQHVMGYGTEVHSA